MKIAIIGSRGYPYVYSGYETFTASGAVKKRARYIFLDARRGREIFHCRCCAGRKVFWRSECSQLSILKP